MGKHGCAVYGWRAPAHPGLPEKFTLSYSVAPWEDCHLHSKDEVALKESAAGWLLTTQQDATAGFWVLPKKKNWTHLQHQTLPISPCLPRGPSVQDGKEHGSENKARNLVVPLSDPMRIYILHPTCREGDYAVLLCSDSFISSMEFLVQWQCEKQRRWLGKCDCHRLSPAPEPASQLPYGNHTKTKILEFPGVARSREHRGTAYWTLPPPNAGKESSLKWPDPWEPSTLGWGIPDTDHRETG